MNRPVLHVLICSTRPGRVGPAVADWMHTLALTHGAFDVRLVDLASFQLPVFDEPEHPRLRRYLHEHTRAWSDSVNEVDSFVFVIPEYNFAPPGALVNALNYLVHEWHYKAVGFVSYGGMSGGIRAVQLTKGLLNALKVVPLLEAVAIPHVKDQLQADGRWNANAAQDQAATVMLDELLRWAHALKPLRAKLPSVCI